MQLPKMRDWVEHPEGDYRSYIWDGYDGRDAMAEGWRRERAARVWLSLQAWALLLCADEACEQEEGVHIRSFPQMRTHVHPRA